MEMAQTLPALAREGADSVFAYVARLARPASDGTWWRILSYDGEWTDNAWGLHTGASGIALFLADYARLTPGPLGDQARDLAEGARRGLRRSRRTLSWPIVNRSVAVR